MDLIDSQSMAMHKNCSFDISIRTICAEHKKSETFVQK